MWWKEKANNLELPSDFHITLHDTVCTSAYKQICVILKSKLKKKKPRMEPCAWNHSAGTVLKDGDLGWWPASLTKGEQPQVPVRDGHRTR